MTSVDGRAGDEPHLAVGHDFVARAHPLRNDRVRTRGALHRDGLGARGTVLLHQEQIGSLLAVHHGLRRHDHRAVFHVELQPHGQELAGPQGVVAVGELALQEHGPGRRVDAVVHERQHALREHRVGLGRAHQHRQPVAVVALDGGEVLLGHGEAHQDRMDLVDDYEGVGVVGAHQVPLAHQQTSGAPRDGGPDGGPFEVERGARDGGGVRVQGRPERIGGGALGIVVRLGDVVPLDQLRVALRVELGGLVLRLVARQHGPGLLERGLEGPRVDLEQHLAGRDVIAFVKRHVGEHARDLGLDRHRLHRLRGPGCGDLERHGALLGMGHGDRDPGHTARAFARTADQGGHDEGRDRHQRELHLFGRSRRVGPDVERGPAVEAEDAGVVRQLGQREVP